MTKPTIRIHNLATDEIIDREMNDAEYAEHLKDVAEREKIEAAETAKAPAAIALAAAVFHIVGGAKIVEAHAETLPSLPEKEKSPRGKTRGLSFGSAIG